MQAVSGFTQIDNCGICLDPQYEPNHWYTSFKQSTKDKVRTLACNHKFHKPCIQEAVNEQIKLGHSKEGKATCPNCRAITDLTSSSKQIGTYIKVYSQMLGTAISLAFIAAAIFLVGRFIEPSSLVVSAIGLVSWFVIPFFLNLAEPHLGNHVVDVSLKLHQWKTGLSLTANQLNFSELTSDKKLQAQYVKDCWIESLEDIIAHKDEYPGITLSERLLDLTTIDSLLETTYENLRVQDPGVFAALHNNSVQSEEWENAFDESLEQLERDGLLTFNEVV